MCRKSLCGGKGTWWGRACPTRRPSPRRGSRARPPQRARWSRPPRRRADSGPPASFHDRRHPSTQRHLVTQLFLFVAGEGGWRETVTRSVCEQCDRLHEAFQGASSGCWSCTSSLMHFFLFFVGIKLIISSVHCVKTFHVWYYWFFFSSFFSVCRLL